MTKLLKALVGLVILVVLVLGGSLIFQAVYPFPSHIAYGVAFSPKYAQYLGEDWKNIYIRILSELKVKNLRLPSYWDVLEPQSGSYDFSDTDFMLGQAKKADAKVILALGERQFRYPECYIPDWAGSLSPKDRHQKLLEFVRRVVERYKSEQTITAWEVENEPLLSSFGAGCDKPDRDFLKVEVGLVRSLDNRPIILTDSGELGFWVTSMKLSDIFGTTVYRKVYNQYLGFLNYPYLPYMYNLKSFLIRSLFAPNNQKTILVEMQAEPWFTDQRTAFADVKDQTRWFSLTDFKNNVKFAKGTGFDTIYLWGVEWWYLMAGRGDGSYLDLARTLFSK